MIPAALPLAGHAHFANLDLFEWILVGIAAVTAGWSIWKAVVFTLRPGEQDRGHVKWSILDPVDRPPGGPA